MELINLIAPSHASWEALFWFFLKKNFLPIVVRNGAVQTRGQSLTLNRTQRLLLL